MTDIYRPRLRILLDPIYIQISNLSGSSTYQRFVRIARELVARGHYVYWCVPDAEYTPNEIENHPQVGIIRTSSIQDQFVIDGLVTDQFFNLFNRVAGKYHIDVLITCRNSLALTYKRLLEPPRFHDVETNFTDKGYGLPVIIVEGFPQTIKRQHVSRSYWWSQCLGYLCADSTIFHSNHNRTEIVEAMSDYLLTSRIKEFSDKSKMITTGIDITELDKIYDPDSWRNEPGFKVLSVGRIFGASYIEFIPWFDYLFKSGLDDVSLTVALSGGFSGPMRAKLDKIQSAYASDGKQLHIYRNNPRDNYIRMLRRFHAFICPVSHYDHPSGVFEALYMGVPGILPVSDYQQSFFRDYPFVVEPKKKEQLIAQLLWIKENPEEARKLIAPWRDYIRQNHNSFVNTKSVADVIEEAARKHITRFKTSAGVLNLIKALKGKKYSWDDVATYLKKAGHSGVSIGDMSMRTTFTYARGAIHHSMALAGYVDTCDSPIETFVRRDEFDKQYIVKDDTPKKKSGIRRRGVSKV